MSDDLIAQCPICDASLGILNPGDTIKHESDGGHTYVFAIPAPVLFEAYGHSLAWFPCPAHEKYRDSDVVVLSCKKCRIRPQEPKPPKLPKLPGGSIMGALMMPRPKSGGSENG